ncbi:unnamed protein product [Schistosoma turkestanicum]|nr:unnamed protein product [Schistosoma turkestanicum]
MFNNQLLSLFLTTVLFYTTTTASSNVSKELNDSIEVPQKSKLLQGVFMHLQCLRIYSEANQKGYWSDICNSNEVLAPYLMITTMSICAPANVWYRTPRYWLAYQQSYFVGSYILLKPGQCITNVRKYGLVSIGSILQCSQIALFGYLPTLSCYYPPQPWRQLSATIPLTPIQPVPPTMVSPSQQVGRQLLSGSVSLVDLQKSSLNVV